MSVAVNLSQLQIRGNPEFCFSHGSVCSHKRVLIILASVAQLWFAWKSKISISSFGLKFVCIGHVERGKFLSEAMFLPVF